MRAVETLPGALLHPDAFPHAPESVELRETHISWVFLAGPNAYKVKKPVRFPFLDYSTLARRRACCWAELELDRRFARSVYHGVVALVPDGRGELRVAPEYDPGAVEFAVVMRRYDEATTLAARLAARRVSSICSRSEPRWRPFTPRRRSRITTACRA